MIPLPGQPTITPAAFARCWKLSPAERRHVAHHLRADGVKLTRGANWPLEQAARALDQIRGQQR
jgi:hypothetical protein